MASAAAGGCGRGGWRVGLRREHGGDHIPELTEEEKGRQTREGLADVDAGRTIPH